MMRKSGMRFTWNGTMSVISRRKNNTFLPGNRNLANAYAAAVSKTTFSATIDPVTMTLFMKGR
jgi:hypothetical protein